MGMCIPSRSGNNAVAVSLSSSQCNHVRLNDNLRTYSMVVDGDAVICDEIDSTSGCSVSNDESIEDEARALTVTGKH